MIVFALLLLVYIVYYRNIMSDKDKQVLYLFSFKCNEVIVYLDTILQYINMKNKPPKCTTRSILYTILLCISLLILPWYAAFTALMRMDSFCFRYPLSHMFECSLYGLANAIDVLGVEGTLKVDCKTFWFDTFKRYNVPTPHVYGTILKNESTGSSIHLWDDEQLQYNRTYAIKSACGGLGADLHFAKPNEFYTLPLQSNKEYIVQDVVESCKIFMSDKQFHARITTIYNSISKRFEVLSIRFNFSKDTTNLNTNQKHGKSNIVTFVPPDLTGLRESVRVDIDIVHRAIAQALKLHSSHPVFSKINVIGWDIILTCNGYVFLEGNLAPTVVFDTNTPTNQQIVKYYVRHT